METPSPWSRRTFLRGTLGAFAAQQLTGCGFASTEVTGTGSPGHARLTARPSIQPLMLPVKGQAVRLGLDALRDGILYVPTSYVAWQPMPLFVALHGSGGSADDWQSYWARAEAHGMIMLVPESRYYTWDLVIGGFAQDVRFINDALDHTFQRCLVDPTRIALGGFSDGASYALSLGVRNGDLFSHLIAYSPGFFIEGDPPAGHPRIFVSHGTTDPILSYARTSTELVPQLEGDGYDVTFHSFDGDHGVPAAVSEAAISWFLDE